MTELPCPELDGTTERPAAFSGPKAESPVRSALRGRISLLQALTPQLNWDGRATAINSLPFARDAHSSVDRAGFDGIPQEPGFPRQNPFARPIIQRAIKVLPQ